MWRVFRDIPKHFRQWNNTVRSTQNVTQSRRDEEQEKDDLQRLTGHNLQNRYYHKNSERQEHDSNDYGHHEQRAEYNEDWRNIFEEKQRLHQCLVEAAGWSTAVALGIHISKTVHNIQKEKHGNGNDVCPTLARACKLALSMPYSDAVKRSILPENNSKATSKKSKEPVSLKDNQNPLQKAWNEFDDVTKQYSGTAYNIQGLQHAKRGDYTSAIQKWQDGSALGHSKSQYNLGLSYELGRGTRRNLAMAAELYKAASRLGHGKASYNLALMYQDGIGGLQKDKKKAFELMENASDAGISKAQTYVGLHCIDERKDQEKAVKLFSEASNKEPDAQYYLGLCLENGWGIASNECKAAQLYSDAAKSGHPGALYNLGVFYEHGLGGLPADTDAALDCYRQAESKGNQSAKFNRQRLEAIAALQLWAYEYSNGRSENTGQPSTSQLNVKRQTSTNSIHQSSSSPTLSDYAKEHFCDFHISGVERQKSTSNVDLAYPNGETNLDTLDIGQRPTFLLGEDDNISDDDDFIQFSDDIDDVSHNMGHSWLGLTHNSTSASDNIACITCS